MKNRSIIPYLAFFLIVQACGNNETTTKETTGDTTKGSNEIGATQKTGTSEEILTSYLSIKNALAADDAQAAGNAAGQMTAAVDNFNSSVLSPEQSKVFNDVVTDIKEHADHIEDNKNNIVHQREHFEYLSQDLIDLMKSVGSSKTLYLDFCPMYNNNKGATWLSEVKEIKNPYLGKEMPKCGEVKEEIKPKG